MVQRMRIKKLCGSGTEMQTIVDTAACVRDSSVADDAQALR
jgi:hypothetical protein